MRSESFGGSLDDGRKRLEYYHQVLDRAIAAVENDSRPEPERRCVTESEVRPLRCLTLSALLTLVPTLHSRKPCSWNLRVGFVA